MVDAGVGRLLIASLHQGISEVVPARLPFYENWLTPPGLSSGRKFGLAPLHAVLSFLRLEGEPTYTDIMQRAGRYSAEWAFEELSSLRRRIVQRCPAPLRVRTALWLSRRMIQQTFRGSTSRVKVKNGVGTLELRGSIFCELRGTADRPMCAFYSAALARFLQRFGIDATVDVRACRAVAGGSCTMAITIRGPRTAESTPQAA
jgi:bacteriochlorophyll 4-vinyl reductase